MPWQCSHTKRITESLIAQYEQTAQPSLRMTATLRNLSERIEHCLRWLPHDVELRMDAAACDLYFGDRRGAIEHYQAALQIDRRPEIYLNLGDALYQTGDRLDAVRAYARLYAFASFIVNYDSRLPWSGDNVIDLIPTDLQHEVQAEGQKERERLGRS